MTKEQLEKLAKVAGVETEDTNSFVYVYYRLKPNVGFRIWQPHEDRDQIAMVIEGLTDEQEKKYNELMWSEFHKTEYIVPMQFGQTVHPSISCEKLLEVI